MTADLDGIRDQQRDTWDRFATGWQAWDTTVTPWLAPVGEAMIRHAQLHDHTDVLDVATGTGEPGLSAAALVPHARITLTDLSERMLKVAADAAANRGLANVETRVCDAGALPFADASFDAVLCRFGLMFFPDIPAAVNDFVRVARPGARISVAVWSQPEKNPWATLIMSTIASRVGMPVPPPDAPGLFRCASDGYVQAAFAQAGLAEITQEEVSCDLVHDNPDRYWDFMTDVAAPVVAGLARADEPTREAIRAEVLALAHDRMRDGRLELRATATVVAGTR
jgi:SAM-dependent methyltransferase